MSTTNLIILIIVLALIITLLKSRRPKRPAPQPPGRLRLPVHRRTWADRYGVM